MSYLTWKMRGLGAAFAIASTVGFVSSAEAIVSRKVWDPRYSSGELGTPLPDLGWSGEVAFDIKDDCLNSILSSGWISNFMPGKCFNKLSIQSAAVTLYDVGDASKNTLLSYDGGSGMFSGDNVNLALRMYVEVDDALNRTLKAVQGGFLFPEFTNASFAVESTYDAAAYWLNFNANFKNDLSSRALEGDFAFLTSCSYRKDAVAPSSGDAFETYSSKHKLDIDVKCSQNDGINYAAVLTPVPEPETYLLALASFGVLGVWARRRRPNAH